MSIFSAISGAQDQTTQNYGKVTISQATFNYGGHSDTYVVPTTGVYFITADGAQGGSSGAAAGGLGAEISGAVQLTARDVPQIVGGGQGGAGGSVLGSAMQIDAARGVEAA
jgi:hypothetical protein